MKDDPKFVPMLILSAGGLLLLLLAMLGLSQIGYSDGYRDGTIQKISKRGLAVKTWEIELATEGIKTQGNSVGNVVQMSVTDSALVAEIEALPAGAKIRVHYKEYVCRKPFGRDTSYVITRIERQ